MPIPVPLRATFELIAGLIPMKRELKEELLFLFDWYQIAGLIPMKRELKGIRGMPMSRPWRIAGLIPMKRELKVVKGIIRS